MTELQPATQEAAAGAVLSVLFHRRRNALDVSESTGKKGEAGRGNMASLLILPVPFFLSH